MKKTTTKPEVWLRGPLPGIPPLIQPVAHALMQAREEVDELMDDFNPDLLDTKPAGLASVRFHLQHLTGVLDRLFTYARGEMLSETQLENLANEGRVIEQNQPVELLITHFNQQIETALEQLENTNEGTLTKVRGVGRAQVPSTVLGLLVHAAEHTMRHVGQLLVTVRVVTENSESE
ncbi:DinB family protein [Salmonirosea aquatica]|uniref:DUF664 domain-containing protein n=1 Tax=Salmonirosea aquatica TaxID=2654236 RepID=A0A7C9F8D8_9BACT|nr:DUF664 domain-containing protein [Cytophagaceae bacterium SJW1-29]